ncbi:hypothetical protein [Kitasatospora sp. NBC_01302]|uniref:hypothetical protein n=1 Tax=Kitasatospora sp. NBC_01302 TaxID=2903575 RepID=UPI002E126FC1|nr:hypothetical protein OG294_24750 [Kitasatospora sp. NBC_01302]
MTAMDCDFCVVGEVAWVFTLPMGFLPSIASGPFGVDLLDDGGWNACGPCAELVERRDKSELIAHVLAVFTEHRLIPNSSAFELAIVTGNLDEQYSALFGAEPTKQPI